MNKSETEVQFRKLIDYAKQASSLAYCPYSNFPVGAALLSFDGQIYTGCNIENCGYTQTIHAEQSAMAKAISGGALARALRAGLSQLEFITAIAVFTLKGTSNWPCCNCRQSLNEFGLDMKVVGEDKHGNVCCEELRQLIPHAFDMEDVMAAAKVKETNGTRHAALSADSEDEAKWCRADVSHGTEDDKWRNLAHHAKNASRLSYCPYSNYPVGAAVLSFDGQIYTGANIENCSYTQTIHAEQTAMANAISGGALQRALDAGLTQHEFIEAIAVYSPKSDEPWPSCNGRQSLNEFGLEISVIGETRGGAILKKQLSDLIPYPFPRQVVLSSIRGL